MLRVRTQEHTSSNAPPTAGRKSAATKDLTNDTSSSPVLALYVGNADYVG
jgi:hypothetical protein